ncbi:uncharacterized protein [Drosophila tropicalis]|uniref:uncharacterized protein n=1 Tax=Drosophila tropicalis TaxID=46794 RepID=UPI0035AB6FAB
MSRYPFNANRTRIRLLATRLPMVPYYLKTDTIGKNLTFTNLLPPGIYSEGAMNPLIPKHKPPYGVKANDEATKEEIPKPQFKQLVSDEEEDKMRKRIEEIWSTGMRGSTTSSGASPKKSGVLQNFNQLRFAMRRKSTDTGIQFTSSIVHLLAKAIVSLHESFLEDYRKLRTLCLADAPPTEPMLVLDQLDIVSFKTNELDDAKLALQEEHRLLTNQLRHHDLQQSNETKPQPDTHEIEEARSICNDVFHLLLDLYPNEEKEKEN